MKCRFKYLFALLFIPVLFGCNDIYDDMYNDMKVSLTDHELYVHASYSWNSIDLPANKYEFDSNNYYIQI